MAGAAGVAYGIYKLLLIRKYQAFHCDVTDGTATFNLYKASWGWLQIITRLLLCQQVPSMQLHMLLQHGRHSEIHAGFAITCSDVLLQQQNCYGCLM